MDMPTTAPELIAIIRKEYERVQRERTEISMLLDQSRGEVDRLTKRNATITNRIALMEQNFDTVPRSDIKATYEASADAQQRLFTMRGQLEKLTSDHGSLERYGSTLEMVLRVLGGGTGDFLLAPGGSGAAEDESMSFNRSDLQALVMRIIDAQENERIRLSTLMHDGPAQSLTNFILQAEIVHRLFDSDPERARVELQNLKGSATNTFQLVRDFISELRPMMLSDLGLIPTARRYASNFGEKTGISVNMIVHGEERRMETHREVVAFRGMQELMDNVRRHSDASTLQITLDLDEYTCRVVVTDNGKGFDAASVLSGTAEKRSLGLPTLRERVELLAGTLTVESATGEGTTATLEIPSQEYEL